MPLLIKKESKKKEEKSILNRVIGAGDGYYGLVKKGQTLRITDINGEQGVDVFFLNADEPSDRYSAVRTIAAQKNIFLTTGTVLYSEAGKELLRIVADVCERHDTLGGACSSQSNTVRYAHEKEYMHNCRDTFMLKISQDDRYSKRDIAPNINILTNVPVTPDGKLWFDYGFSYPGCYIEFEALNNVMLLISNCPQINNPCTGYNPTPVRLNVWD